MQMENMHGLCKTTGGMWEMDTLTRSSGQVQAGGVRTIACACIHIAHRYIHNNKVDNTEYGLYGAVLAQCHKNNLGPQQTQTHDAAECA